MILVNQAVMFCPDAQVLINGTVFCCKQKSTVRKSGAFEVGLKDIVLLTSNRFHMPCHPDQHLGLGGLHTVLPERM